jgi:GDPmannose 4,6-dehydratase
MWLMLQRQTADDYVIATGTSRSLEDFVASAFSRVGLNWRTHVQIDESLFRPTDIRRGNADPSRALRDLGWQPKKGFDDVVRLMVEAESDAVDR